MEPLLRALLKIPEVAEAAAGLAGGHGPVAMTGLSPIHRAQVAAALALETGRPLVMVCAEEGEAGRLAGDLQALTGRTPLSLYGTELYIRPGAVTSREWEHRRIAALYDLAEGRGQVVVATAEGLLQKVPERRPFQSAAITLKLGERYDLEALPERLVAAGYTRCDQVEGPGQFALRGGILDVFSPLMEEPVRCDFFDDEVDAMGAFDVATQRRTRNVKSALVLPASLGEATDSAFTYLPDGALVVLGDGGRIAERVKGVLWQAKEDTEVLLESGEAVDLTARLLTQKQWEEALSGQTLCMMEALPTSRYVVPPKALLAVNAKQLSSYGGSLDTAAADMEHYLSAGCAVLLLCGNPTRGKNLQRILEERGIRAALDFQGQEMPAPGQARITVGSLSAGSEWPALKLAILTEGQLTTSLSGRAAKPRRAARHDSNRQKIQSYTDLVPGDLVVHAHHGIGRFVGMQRLPVDGVEKDYIKIAYAGSDCLYVPATQLDLVSKYIGGGGDEDGHRTRLNKLGGTDWQKQKSRAKAAAKDLAKGLIALYAQRQRQPGFAFSPDSPWQQEFEAAFDYTETEDQLRCIAEIKKDMERPVPMDRLLCGDVGYGKTEVALRAVMKCILDGKQAAILVPTTVLAQQHFATAVSRFRGFPVTVRVLSRFQTPGQSRQILQEVRSGRVDLLIGTHRLLQKDIAFKDLGLLIIDEEQRFGVTHKEKLKEMAKQVDVLTLSATPIPRTLNMALSGIRDMSTLEEPPQDRQPVQTYVLEHDWGILADAMRRELERGGQVYYLHNRVETIDRTAGRIQAMLPEARVAVAHGKMTQEAINDVMSQMTDGEVDILVCTTIIETGIDIPNANTLIIEDADKMGLSQLHQLRGRVGRSARRAFAYMTYRQGKVLSEVQSKRLAAIREFAEFGSGFKIAMRDLEIRGAGNVLGPEQSGFLVSVGYDMYLKLLEEAVLEQKGEAPKVPAECSADLTVAASIPDRYVPSPEQRMDLYRRIARIRSEAEADDLVDELVDRYGDPPRTVNNLISVALLRAAAAECGFSEIAQKGESLLFTLREVDFGRVSALCGGSAYRGRLLFSAGEKPYLALKVRKGEDTLKLASRLIQDFQAAAPAQG